MTSAFSMHDISCDLLNNVHTPREHGSSVHSTGTYTKPSSQPISRRAAGKQVRF